MSQPAVVEGIDSQRKKRKVATCAAFGKEGHSSRNRKCEKFTERVPVPRVNIETPSDPISPVPIAPEIEGNDDEPDEENEVLAEDEVLDEIDVDEGLAHEEQTNGDWTETSFEDAEDIPPFDHEWGANVSYMQENSCSSCLDSFTCFIDDECLCTFVTATNNFGSQHFGSKWKPLDVNEFKTILAAIFVFGLIPVSSRDSAWGDNGLDSFSKKP